MWRSALSTSLRSVYVKGCCKLSTPCKVGNAQDQCNLRRPFKPSGTAPSSSQRHSRQDRHFATCAQVELLSGRAGLFRSYPGRCRCMRSTTGTQQSTAQSSNSSSKSLTYTAYEGNSWQITFDQSGQGMPHTALACMLGFVQGDLTTTCSLAGVTVLVDPWLEGDLVFANQTWLYRGKKGALKDVDLDLDQIGSQADVILLSQVTQSCLTCCVYCNHSCCIMRSTSKYFCSHVNC